MQQKIGSKTVPAGAAKATSPQELLQIFLKEMYLRRRTAALMFCTILITSGLVVITVRNLSSYESAATVYVAEKNIISPLMEGAAVSASVTDQAETAKELIFSQRIMNQILDVSGLAEADATPIERERLMDKVQKRMTITNVAATLIRISYKDNDPRRAQKVAEKASELFVSEGMNSRITQSEEAFHFIEAQTNDYHSKLIKAELEIKDYRTAHFDARIGTEAELNTRIDQLNRDIEATRTLLAEAGVRRDSIESQLSGESENMVVITQEASYRTRIAELRAQIEELRVNFQDAHPEIVRRKLQIDDLQNSLREAKTGARSPGSGATESPTIVDSPVYAQLRSDLVRTKTEIASLGKRLSEYQNQLGAAMNRGRTLSAGEAKLAEITRNYEINRGLYNDLLRRRENARLSMNLGRTEQGPALKIQERATLPLQATGLRLLHILIASPLLGLLVPCVYVFSRIQLDARIRDPKTLSAFSGIPVLPVLPTPMSRERVLDLQREAGALTAAAGISGLIFLAFVVARLAQPS